jgi:hypothetical protein
MTRKSKRELEKTLEQLSTPADDVRELTDDELSMLLLRDAHGYGDLSDARRRRAEEEWQNRFGIGPDSNDTPAEHS